MSKTYTVYEVLYDGKGSGPCGDGTYTARFKKEADASSFANGKTYYGKPTEVQTRPNVSSDLMKRWTREGKIR